MATLISIGGGVTLGPGVAIGQPDTPPTPPTGDGVVTFTEMTAGGNQSNWLQDPTATMITDGFTLNTVSGTGNMTNGVAIAYLTANNKSFFSTYGTGNKTATWFDGSSITTMTVNLTQNNPDATGGLPQLVFFMNEVTTFPSTFVFPVVFS